nr:MAG TPA: hypothetical protein [Bacteriophage sp.]
MKEEMLRRYNENLVKAVKADLCGRTRDSDFLFGNASGMMTSAYIMFNVLGSDVVAKMSRALDLAYDIVMHYVENEEESLWILENNMA